MSTDDPTETGGGIAGILDDYPDVDKHSCQLLGPTALIVQALMGVFVILSLVYKRHREPVKRPWRVWLFDVSKQVIGQMFVHGVNVLVSDLVSKHSDENACVFYFFNILVDTTLGVALLYIILHVLTYLCVEKAQLKGFESGVYGRPPSVTFWMKQAVLYVVALTTMKLLVLGLLAVFPGLFVIGAWLLSWTKTGDGDALQVIFTMGIFPIIMNVLQFWLIDSIVKASDSATLSLETDAHDGLDREPLFGVSSDDEDDDDIGPQRHDIENPRPTSPKDLSRSHSPGKSTGSATPLARESKSSGSSSTEEQQMHAYPPSLSSSVTSSSSASSIHPPIREAKLPKKKKAAPAPLSIQRTAQPAVNSPAPVSAPPMKAAAETEAWQAPAPHVTNTEPAEDWDDSWGDNDDWADRVGEEDWTGRRIEETKENLWEMHSTEGRVHAIHD